jgi:hypothetical protein
MNFKKLKKEEGIFVSMWKLNNSRRMMAGIITRWSSFEVTFNP